MIKIKKGLHQCCNVCHSTDDTVRTITFSFEDSFGGLEVMLCDKCREDLQRVLASQTEKKTYVPHFNVHDTVYIVDRFDLDNDCSQLSDGSGSKNIELRVRKCFVTSICVNDNKNEGTSFLYFVQPYKLTERENCGLYNFYWEQCFYAANSYDDQKSAVYATKEEAIKAIGKAKCTKSD